ncbi:MAG: hypothetical protein STSR0008_18130 [Ignavibacterium sp.]
MKIKIQIIILITLIGFHAVNAQSSRNWKVYLIPYSHIDVGYTNSVPIVLEQHQNYLDTVLSFIERSKNFNDGEKFKWTVEITWPLQAYIENRSSTIIDSFFNEVKLQNIEIGAFHFGLQTDLCGNEELIRSLYYANELSDYYNFEIKSALINDTPGFTWSLAQILEKSHIPFLSLGMNSFLSNFYSTTNLPYLFYWEGQGENKTLIWRCIDTKWAYLEGQISYQVYVNYASMESKITSLLQTLEQQNYPYDVVLINCATGDNGAPNYNIVNNVIQWNQSHTNSKLIISTPSEFYNYIVDNYSNQIPTFKGDAPNWWDWLFAPSSTKGFSISRQTQSLLPNAEKFSSIAKFLVNNFNYKEEEISNAYINNLLFEDHNLGAINPDGNQEFWNYKMNWISSAYNSSKEIFEYALNSICENVNTNSENKIVVFNSLNWNRTDYVKISVNDLPSLASYEIYDEQTNEKIAMQYLSDTSFVFLAKDIPSLGFKTYRLNYPEGMSRIGTPSEDFHISSNLPPINTINNFTLENNFYKIEVNATNSGINSIYDKILNKELTKGDSKFNQYIYNGSSVPTSIQVVSSDSGEILQSIKIRGSVSGSNYIEKEIVLYNQTKRIDFYNNYDKLPATSSESESVDFNFNFNITAPQLHYEIPFGYVKLFDDELSGFRTNHYAAQRWMNISSLSENYNAILATQNASINAYPFGFNGDVRMLVSYNNVSSAYRAGVGELEMNFALTSTDQQFIPAFNYKFSYEFNNPLIGKIVSENQNGIINKKSFSFLEINSNDIIISTVKKAIDDDYIIRLFNTSTSSLQTILQFSENIIYAYETTPIEDEISSLPYNNKEMELNFNPFEIKTIKVKLYNPTSVKELKIINDFVLEQNYPNPFNSSTTINYQIPKDEFVVIKIYDLLGKEISTLVNEFQSKGKHKIIFNSNNISNGISVKGEFASGVYFYQLVAGEFIDTKKLIILK